MTLDDYGAILMMVSASIVIGCLIIVFALENQLSVGWLVLGHACAMLGAVGVKIGYLLKLEAQSQANR